MSDGCYAFLDGAARRVAAYASLKNDAAACTTCLKPTIQDGCSTYGDAYAAPWELSLIKSASGDESAA